MHAARAVRVVRAVAAALVIGLLAGCGGEKRADDRGGAAAAGGAFESPAELAGLARRDDARMLLFSSHDREGGNDDGFSSRYSYLRRDERGEFVVAEVNGSGSVRRIWMTWPGRDVTLRVAIDGDESRSFAMPVSELFARAKAQAAPSLAGTFEELGGVGFSYVPVHFTKSIRISTDAPLRFYQIDVETGGARDDAGTGAEEGRGPDPSDGGGPDHRTTSYSHVFWRVEPGESRTVLERDAGPGVVRRITIALEGEAPPLRELLLSLHWDGARDPAVHVPLSELAGSAFAPTGLRSLPVVASEDTITLLLPMPCESMRAVVTNASADTVRGSIAIALEERALGDDELRLHAHWREVESVAGEPIDVLSVNGFGHYVGTLMSAIAARGDGFLEGDEMFFIDDDPALTRNGTGTEDYFNSGWYFAGGVRHFPYHGVTFQSDAGAPRFSAYRWHVTDRVPFQRSLRLIWEHGEWNNQPGALYSVTPFWYERSPRGRAPADRPGGWLPRRVRFPKNTIALGDRFHWNDAVVDTGQAYWSDVTDAWSAPPASIATDRIVPFLEGKRGGVARFRTNLTIPADGEYDVRLAVGRGPGFGRIDAEIDRQRLLQAYACDADTLEPLHMTPATRLRLDAGVNVLLLFARQPADTSRAFPLPANSSMYGIGRRLLGYVAGVAIEPAGPFVEPWRIVGPFDGSALDRTSAVFGPEEALRAGDGVDPAGSYPGRGGRPVAWKEVRADSAGYVDLRAGLAPGTHHVGYALTYCYAPTARAVVLSIGSDDGVVAFLNGQEIWRHRVNRGYTEGDDRLVVRLDRGWNDLLLKVDQYIAGWGFSVRVSDPDRELTFATVKD